MALKFTEKLKGIDLGKRKETLSEVASSVTKLFDRKDQVSTMSNVKENVDADNELGNVPESTIQNVIKEESEHVFYQKVSQYVTDNTNKFKQWCSDSQLENKLSVTKLFDRKDQVSTISNVKENVDVDNELESVPESTTPNVIKEESEHVLYQKISQYITDNANKLKQWYSDSQLEKKLSAVAKKVGVTLIYPVLLLYNLLKSADTKAGDKYLIIASLAYFIVPTDVIPDVIISLGYSDDALALTTALNKISTSISPALKNLTRKQCENLIGSVDDEIISDIKNQQKDNHGIE